MRLEIIPQSYFTASGKGKSWAVIIDGEHKIFYRREDVVRFLEGILDKQHEQGEDILRWKI